jgi:hypothetical protein
MLLSVPLCMCQNQGCRIASWFLLIALVGFMASFCPVYTGVVDYSVQFRHLINKKVFLKLWKPKQNCFIQRSNEVVKP